MKKDRFEVVIEALPPMTYRHHKAGFYLFAQLRPSDKDSNGMVQSQHLLVKPTQRQLRRYKKAFMRKATTSSMTGV